MKKNMGMVDRGIRVVIALAVAVLYFTGTITGVVAIILGILAVVFLVTSLTSTCPIYKVLGLSTRTEQESEA